MILTSTPTHFHLVTPQIAVLRSSTTAPASVVFMEQVIKEERRLLAVFPVFFFYTFIGWMVLLQ